MRLSTVRKNVVEARMRLNSTIKRKSGLLALVQEEDD